MKKIIIILIFGLTTVGHAQTLFEDESGNSSFYLNDGPNGWIKFNSSSSSVSLGYNRMRDVGFDFPNWHNHNYILGVNLTAKAEKGIASVLSEDKFVSGVGGEILLGLLSNDLFDENNSMSSYFFKFGLSNSKFTTIDIDNFKKNKDTEWIHNLSFNLNFRLNKPYEKKEKGRIIYHFIGTALGIKRVTNLETLKSVELQKIITNNEENQIVETIEGKAGDLNLTSATYFYLDYGITPYLFKKNQIGFNIYYRGNYGGFKSVNNLGLGVFFAKKDQPKGILGGLAWQFNDLDNNLESKNDFLTRSTVFFYVGYNL